MANRELDLRLIIRADGSLAIRNLNQVDDALDRVGHSAQQTDRSFGNLIRSTFDLGGAFRALVSTLSALALFEVSKRLIDTADSMKLLMGRIQVATSSQQDFIAASEELVAISLRTGTSFEANATLFARINKAVETMGGSMRDTTALTETMAKAIRISGTSAGEAASVVRQLSQALASGVLRGDEFNSIMENGSRLAYALAAGLNVNVGELRKMAEDGELSAEKVIKAIMSQSATIDAEYKKIPLTVGVALENVKTQFGQYIKSVDAGNGATAGLSDALNTLAKNLTPLLDTVVTLGKVTVAVVAGQMLSSISQYIAAKTAAITLERAHAAAILMDLERTAALAAATLAGAQANNAASASTLALTQAEIAATQARLAGNLSIAERMGLTGQLNVLLAAQAAQTTALAAATAELTAAQEASVAAIAAQNAAAVTLAGTLKLLLNPLNLLNAALAIFVGWEFGKLLNQFEFVRINAEKVSGVITHMIENITYSWNVSKAAITGNIEQLERLKETHLLVQKAIDESVANSIKKRGSAQTAINKPPTEFKATTGSAGSGAKSKALDDAKQQAAAETQIQLDKIARIEQIANAEFANDMARAKAQSAEKMAAIKGDKAAELAIEQELADAKAQIERNQLEAGRSFAEERLRAQLVGKQQELALTSDRGEQAKINAEIVKIEEQIKAARELSGLAAQKLGIDETAAAAQRAQAQQALVYQVILKYDILAARMKEFDADAAIVNASNLPLERKKLILDNIAVAYGKAGIAAKDSGDQMSQFAEQAARNVQDSFANYLFNPFQNGLKGMLLGFIDMTRQIISQALAADLANAIGLGGKDNKGGNSQGLLNGVAGMLSGGADDAAQVAANEAAKAAAVEAGQAAQVAAVTAGETSKAAAVQAGQAAQVGAVVTGETTKNAAETAGQSKSLATTLITTAKKIHAYAASAAAGAYDAMASIPYVGPVLGAAAAAVTYAAVMAFGVLTGGAAFAAGGRVDATRGGRMSGPGTGTSDSIRANVSNNEHVIKEVSVSSLDKKYGSGFLDYLNENGDLPPSLKTFAAFAGGGRVGVPVIPKLNFSGGGRVDSNAGSRNSNSDRVVSAPSDKTPVNIFNITDERMVHDAMAKSAGTRIVLNAITNNPRAVRQALEI